MAYTFKNFKTKKDLKRAVEAGERLSIYEPGIGRPVDNGTAYIEGPRPVHKWYAQVEMERGCIKRVIA